jgi:S-adenosylmethionine:tRNA ribosyltransferase-isomerase
MNDKTSDFDFYLPQELIAIKPAEKRDMSRLLVLHRDGRIEHRMFFNIYEYLREGDMLLLNNTKVFPAGIIGIKPSGGKLDMLLFRKVDENNIWEIMCKGNFEGTVTIGDDIKAEVWIEKVKGQETRKFLRFLNINSSSVMSILWQYGHMPLPPYIKRKPDDSDKQRYQTVYAEHEGSVAAPTAGLHFTEELLDKIKDKGVLVDTLTLHVGVGTFKSIKAEHVKDHEMDAEYFEIKLSLIDKIQQIKESGNKLIAVGTTVTRVLEGYLSGQWSEVNSQNKDIVRGYTSVFIYPGYEFKAVDSLITNFHLPKSTPLMLVSAMRGFKNISAAYKEAVDMEYRFFSYGDAMLIL